MPIVTDHDELRDLVRSATKINETNYNHYQEHLEEIQDNYGGCVIAVHDGSVIASRGFTDDLDELREFLIQIRDEHGEEVVKEAYITHVPDRDQVLIF